MKYAIVTGASPSSIGFLAAKKLASPEFGYKVILACRSSAKGKEAERLIRESYPTCQVEYIQLDLSSFESIRKFVDDVHALDNGAICDPEKPGSLSILINNAGVGWGQETPYVETLDGLEEIVGVNHFGTFLLTQLLMEDLKKAEDGARVTIVSSSLHAVDERLSKPTGADADPLRKKLVLPDFPKDLLQTAEDYDGFKAYQVSKLCNLWYTYELQRRLDGETDTLSSVRINAVSPGFIPTTGLTRRAGAFGVFFLKFVLDPLRHLGIGITRSPEEGAEVMVQVSTLDVASQGAQYFELPKGADEVVAVPSSDESMDETKAKELWELSLKTCKLDV